MIEHERKQLAKGFFSVFFFAGIHLSFLRTAISSANQTLVRAMSDRLCLEKGCVREGSQGQKLYCTFDSRIIKQVRKKRIFYLRNVFFGGWGSVGRDLQITFRAPDPFCLLSLFHPFHVCSVLSFLASERGETTSREQNFPKRKTLKGYSCPT